MVVNVYGGEWVGTIGWVGGWLVGMQDSEFGCCGHPAGPHQQARYGSRPSRYTPHPSPLIISPSLPYPSRNTSPHVLPYRYATTASFHAPITLTPYPSSPPPSRLLPSHNTLPWLQHPPHPTPGRPLPTPLFTLLPTWLPPMLSPLPPYIPQYRTPGRGHYHAPAGKWHTPDT